MSLPPGFLDELRSRLSLTQVVGRKVLWDPRKSNQSKGDMWAPCPFHQEKTASFHVVDREGYYYCFGCHAKGDAISFVRETENVGFMEAVEILAREAGMPMPKQDPQAQEKADRRTQLAEVMELAVKHFRLQLNTSAATDARRYLDGRGLTQDVCARWEIGFAPDLWQGLWDHLKAKDVPDDLILGAGLAKPSSKGGKPYDTFRGRIIYSIRDARGRAIAFGGRAMDPNDGAKYLNSPETELFDKGRSLYNHGPARAAAGKGKSLIVAEGYMDVIALSEAGFDASLAPLGTAITQPQLEMLWRIAPEPVIALDGDTAGLRAAMRLIDLALPLLEAGKSLRFALMPQGKDPDDVLRESGSEAIETLLESARPMVQLLWQRETEGRVFDSPERKAALDKALATKTGLIKDPNLRRHYEQELKDFKWQLFRRGGQERVRGGARRPTVPAPLHATKTSALAATEDPQVTEHLREAVILGALAQCPGVIEFFEAELERLRCADPTHARLRDILLRSEPATSDVVQALVAREIGEDALENHLAQPHVAVVPCIRTRASEAVVRMTVSEEIEKLQAWRGRDAEIIEAAEDLSGVADEGVTWRLTEAAKAADAAQRTGQEDRAEYEIGENGARISRNERDALDALLATIKSHKTRD
ncbi:MAG: DNA primase [Pseudomonadota bacterium]